MGFSRQEYWSGLPCPPLGDLLNPGIEPESLASSALASGFFTTAPPGKPLFPPEEIPVGRLECDGVSCAWTVMGASVLSPPDPLLRCLSWCCCGEHAGERRVHSIPPAFQARGDLSPAGKTSPASQLSGGCSGERAVRPGSCGLSMEALKDPQSLAQGPVWSEGVKMMQ